MLPVNRLILVISLASLVAGCSAMSTTTQTDMSSDVRKPSDLANCERNEQSGHSLKPELVAKLLAEQRFHAALAQLDALPSQTAYTRYLRAHTLRLLDRSDEAAAIYRELLNTCMQGYAHHGLGLLAASHGDLAAAQDSLLKARDMLPLDARVRNDAGYVLLLAEQPQQAYFEFMTALELNEDNRQPRHNALLTLIVLERRQQANAFAERMELTEADVSRAHARAQQLQRGWTGGYQTAEGAHSASAGLSDALPLELETDIEVTRER